MTTKPKTPREAAAEFDLDAWLEGLAPETVEYCKMPGIPKIVLQARTAEWAESLGELEGDELRNAYVAGHIIEPVELADADVIAKIAETRWPKIDELNLVCIQLDTLPDGVSPHFLRAASA